MWVFTQDGFISAVDNNQKPGLLTVRSRDRQSLVMLAEIAETSIEFTPGRDYQYRTFVTREAFTEFMTAQIDTLDYHNFKDRLRTTRGYEYSSAAGQVWTVMHDVIDDAARDHYYGSSKAKAAAADRRKHSF